MAWASGNHLDDRQLLWWLIRALPLACLPFVAGSAGIHSVLRLADGHRGAGPAGRRGDGSFRRSQGAAS
jgi:hypothetical protein